MLPAAVKNKIEQIWLDVIAGGVSQPTEVIEQLTYLMFAKQIDEREADIETAELLSGQKQTHIFGESKEEQALRWRNFKGMEARELYKHFVEHVFVFLINMNSDENSAFSRCLKHAIFKINEPLALQNVITGLERIFTEELGTAEDYQTNYQDTPLGLLIRKIAKMDRDAAYAAFSTFIAEERPNAEQIHFIEQVVDYVVENGYINNVLDLMKAPFDRPYKFSVILLEKSR